MGPQLNCVNSTVHRVGRNCAFLQSAAVAFLSLQILLVIQNASCFSGDDGTSNGIKAVG